MAVDDKVIENLSTMASAANPPIDDLGATGFPSIAALTAEYDAKFFGGSLRDWCDVEWSAKMTMCAGICYYKKLPPMSLIQRATALSCVDGTVGGVSKSGRLSGQTAKRRRRQPAKGTLNDFWKTLEADPASLKVSSSTDSSPSTSPLLSDEERERVNGQRASTQPNNNISEHKDEEPIEETLKVPKNEPTKEPLKEPLEGAINDGMDVDERVAILMSRYPRCVIRLSEPLLKYRPLVDLKQTLIHEMIHAYCFMNKLEASRDGHGEVFQHFMRSINRATGLDITVYHSFSDEVAYHKKYIWRCSGTCAKKAPYFGIVARAQNRAPGPSSFWWSSHQATCGGTFQKIAPSEDIDSTRESASGQGTRSGAHVGDTGVESVEYFVLKYPPGG